VMVNGAVQGCFVEVGVAGGNPPIRSSTLLPRSSRQRRAVAGGA
jgi:hypothetical protein